MSDTIMQGNPSGSPLEAVQEPGPVRLIATLGVAGFFSGLILAGAFLFTQPIIQENQARSLREAIFKVLPGCVDYKTLEMRGGQLVVVDEKSGPASSKDAKQIFAGYDSTGRLIGYAIPGKETGYQDIISAIFGYDHRNKVIIGFEVLESKETPGLGDKIMKDAAFKANFQSLAVDPEIVAVKKGEKRKPNEVEAITGATISSKAVVRLLDKGVKEWREVLPVGSSSGQ
jgi:Na+-translocating ferredoxin:NAD+ oxidoreductase subunit G